MSISLETNGNNPPQTGFVQNFTYDIHQDACSFLCEQQNDARSQNDCNDWGPAATSLFQV